MNRRNFLKRLAAIPFAMSGAAALAPKAATKAVPLTFHHDAISFVSRPITTTKWSYDILYGPQLLDSNLAGIVNNQETIDFTENHTVNMEPVTVSWQVEGGEKVLL
jgi:hypothetical protein